jgi:hypothetical protein
MQFELRHHLPGVKFKVTRNPIALLWRRVLCRGRGNGQQYRASTPIALKVFMTDLPTYLPIDITQKGSAAARLG